MKFLTEIRAARHDPQQLEQLFRAAQAGKAADEFTQDLILCYQEFSDNLLYAAWYYRLQQSQQIGPTEQWQVNWTLAVPLSILSGVFLYFLYDPKRLTFTHPDLPYLALLWSPFVALVVMSFLVFTARKNYRQAGLIGVGIVAVTAYTMWCALEHSAYRDLMVAHLPLLSWTGMGILLVGVRSTVQAKFSFLIKSIEVIVTGGVYGIAMVLFAVISVNMFQTLGIHIGNETMTSIIVGLAGLVPVIAVASAYNPQINPTGQEFTRGVGKLISTFPRILLALTLIVLVIYVIVIPFNFWGPFENRDVLIVYNVMLFAVMGLLVGATPLQATDLSPRYQAILRTGIVSVALLVVLVSLYAVAAILYRTTIGGLTINRLAVIGWNLINIGLLLLLLYRQRQADKATWYTALQSAFQVGCFLYPAWTLVLLLATPWLFPA